MLSHVLTMLVTHFSSLCLFFSLSLSLLGGGCKDFAQLQPSSPFSWDLGQRRWLCCYSYLYHWQLINIILSNNNNKNHHYYHKHASHLLTFSPKSSISIFECLGMQEISTLFKTIHTPHHTASIVLPPLTIKHPYSGLRLAQDPSRLSIRTVIPRFFDSSLKHRTITNLCNSVRFIQVILNCWTSPDCFLFK